jgi:predicted SnoaL-like aldol condensation-catalyzing enzyme
MKTSSYSSKAAFALVLAGSLLTGMSDIQAAPKQSTLSVVQKETLEKRNKAMVVKFYDEFFNKHRIAAADTYLAPDYKQHNPMAATGREPVKKIFTEVFKKFPQSRAQIKRVLADGDLVALHVHSKATPKDLGRAVVDIFRVKNGTIVEHWDVVQPVPAKSANNNTMF